VVSHCVHTERRYLLEIERGPDFRDILVDIPLKRREVDGLAYWPGHDGDRVVAGCLAEAERRTQSLNLN